MTAEERDLKKSQVDGQSEMTSFFQKMPTVWNALPLGHTVSLATWKHSPVSGLFRQRVDECGTVRTLMKIFLWVTGGDGGLTPGAK